ncbi:hypothetical protein [Aequorivita lipolytica]|uniref:Uncharacterized protein n=1 Tax=Aequorivita lipolytica TaxID=153267 RepID=A0A5C6YSM5_9FLAO|nr:hypothetical protein [Aequorivita lipolytica]TXD70406.1 hypothetical protein ESV24_04360 [Aequorivita lipolytica]
MKSIEKHINKLLVSVTVFLVFGNVAVANEVLSANSKTAVISELQEEDHGKPFIFNEVYLGEVSQTVSQNEYLGLDLAKTTVSHQNFSFARVSSNYSCFYSSKDKRELIFRHIFPFHFFW